MQIGFDNTVIFCNFCNKPILPNETRTVDIKTGLRFCHNNCSAHYRNKN
jgi:hypothetical protein